MSKNLTRKGLAFGALIALGTTLIAGAPAQAANVSIAPSAGTGNTTILGEAFTVKATVDSLVPSSAWPSLKFKVTNDAGAALTYLASNGADDALTQVDAASAETVDGTYSAGTGTSDIVKDTDGAATAGTATLSIKTSETAATSVSVVAFLDADGGNDLDASEYQTAAYEVKFVKAADAGLTVAWSGQLLDDTVSATVKSTVVNVGQFVSGHVQVKFGKYVSGVKKAINIATGSGDTYSTSTDGNTITANLNADEDALVITASNLHADFQDMSAGAYIAQAVFAATGSTTYSNAGPVLSFTLGASEADATESTHAITPSDDVTSAGVVRKSYKGNVVYSVTAKDVDGKVLAGKVVRLTTGTSDSAGTFKVNGVTAADSTAYDATTNASGVATFTVTNTSGAVGDTFAVGTIVIDGVQETANATDLEWTAASYTVYEKAVFAASQLDRAVSGSSTTLTYVVLDQWKKALTGADYRVKLNLSGSTVSAPTDTLADGSATFTIADGGLDTTNYTTVVDPRFEEYVSSAWTETESTIASVSNPADLNINWYASQTDKITWDGITSTGTDAAVGSGSSELSAVRAEEKAVAVDTTFSNVPEVFAPGGSEAVTLAGDVSNAATAAPKKGALITVSGDANILFNVGTAWGLGSLTFNADADGTFSIDAYSNKVLTDSVVTVTSNGVSKTAKVSFTAVSDDSDVVDVVVSAPAYLAAGRSASITFTAVDKYGNAVNLTDGTAEDDITITTSGAGYLTSYPTTFTKGVATVVLITQPNDTGATTLKIVAAIDAEDDITKTATVTIGSAPVAGATAAIAGSTKKFYVSVSNNTAAKNVVVKVAGKTVATLKGAAAKKTYTVKATKGSKKVTVYVGGKLIATKTVSVK